MKLSLYDSIEKVFNYSESGVTRIGTGIEPVDEKIRGVAPGEVCMILGRSYAGKSLMAQNIIANNPLAPSIFFSMEMPYVQAVTRLYAMTKGVSASKLLDNIEAGNPPSDMWELINHYPKHGLVEETNLGFSAMSIYLQEYDKQFGLRPEFVVIDYLELIGGAKRSGEGLGAIDRVATHLKDWAKEEDMRVFVLHQCNRNEPKWEPPTESSPRYGGYTESDFVIGMWKPAFDPELSWEQKLWLQDKVHLNILKNRPFGADAEEIVTRVDPSLRILPT